MSDVEWGKYQEAYKAIHDAILPPSSFFCGDKNVAVADTPEALGSGIVRKGVLIQAKETNTGKVFVGNSMVQKVELGAGESTVIVVDNLSKVYINVEIGGEGVNYLGA